MCPALVDSILWRRSDAPTEVLTAYPKLVSRLVAQAGWIPEPAALAAAAERHPRRAAQAVAATLDLRAALFRLFSALVFRRQPQPLPPLVRAQPVREPRAGPRALPPFARRGVIPARPARLSLDGPEHLGT